jgi:hypothetical protein
MWQLQSANLLDRFADVALEFEENSLTKPLLIKEKTANVQSILMLYN